MPGTAPYSWQGAVEGWDEIRGIGRRVAEQLVAEIGTDMSWFPNAAHLASWARLAPGNRESAGKRLSGATGRGNRWLRQTLIQAAHAAVKVKASISYQIPQMLEAYSVESVKSQEAARKLAHSLSIQSFVAQG